MAKIYASTSDAITQREIDHAKIAQWAATQGMVLLENDGSLPLSKTTKNIALYGRGGRRTEKGGTGSGDVNQRKVTNIEEGFTNAGYTITTTQWLDDYDTTVEQARTDWRNRMMRMAEETGQPVFRLFFRNRFITPFGRAITEEDVANSNTDTAFYVISRNCGEGTDRKHVEGDYELAPEEIRDLTFLGTHYEHVIVILNTAVVVDTKFFHEIPGLSSLLLMSLAGTASGDSLLEVLTGNVTPSGKLTATWAKNYSDYPASATFSHNDDDVVDENYNEGIYVGYRYFDTFNVTPAYPFGYGLSYTTFSMETNSVTVDNKHVTLQVTVTNTGSCAGKEVVQVYYSAPDGKLEKPYQELAAFGKTKELQPGESQTLTLTYKTGLMASYEEASASWILEAGTYFIRVGNCSRNTQVVAKIQLDATAVTEVLSNRFPLEQPLNELSKAGTTPYGYEQEEAEKAAAPTLTLAASSIETKHATYNTVREAVPANTREEKLTLHDVINGNATLDELIAQLTVAEMADLCVGAHSSNNTMSTSFGNASMIGNSSVAVPGAAGDTTSNLIDDRGIANLILSDGPAGLRLAQHFRTTADGQIIRDAGGFMAMMGMADMAQPEEELPGITHYYQFSTAIPCGILLAQSWDYDVMYKMGDLVGREMNEYGVTIWLAPALNILRDPLCGRTFEYYSEDPLVAGLIAAADTDGIQAHPGIGVSAKHFAVNSQEVARTTSSSNVSERAIREIYLRGFEMCVRASQPMTIMSSYNLLNGLHTANSYDLLTAVARDEWGFAGAVMTDWGTTGGGPGRTPEAMTENPITDLENFRIKRETPSIPSLCIYAGNDWIMPGTDYDVKNIIASVESNESTAATPYPITRADLENCVRNILKIVMQSSSYEGAKPYSAQFEKDWFFTAK